MSEAWLQASIVSTSACRKAGGLLEGVFWRSVFIITRRSDVMCSGRGTARVSSAIKRSSPSLSAPEDRTIASYSTCWSWSQREPQTQAQRMPANTQARSEAWQRADTAQHDCTCGDTNRRRAVAL